MPREREKLGFCLSGLCHWKESHLGKQIAKQVLPTNFSLVLTMHFPWSEGFLRDCLRDNWHEGHTRITGQGIGIQERALKLRKERQQP